MPQQHPGPGRLRAADARAWRPARLAFAAGLLAVVTLGLRAAVPAPSLDGPFRHDGLAVGAGLEAVLAAALIALLVRNARAPRHAVLAARLRRVLLYPVLTGLAAIPVAYLYSRTRPARLRPRPAPSRTPAGHPGQRPSQTANSPWLGHIVLIVLAGLAVAALACALVWLIRNWRRLWAGWRRRPGRVALVPALDTGDEAGLRTAVASGRTALSLLDDARAAIIACYVAMEDSLAQAGTARAAADTPDELLARAAGQGLVQTGAAARLTALFYEARFSSHPMPPRQRDEAQHALDEMAASLHELQPAGGGPGHGSPAGPGASGAGG